MKCHPSPPPARIELMERAAARKNFARSPPLRRCEIIANHYVALATTALALSRIIESSRHQESESINDVVKYLYDTLKDRHLSDFGTYPSWELPPVLERDFARADSELIIKDEGSEF